MLNIRGIECKGQKNKASIVSIKKELYHIYHRPIVRAGMAKINSTDLRIVELVNKHHSLDSVNLKGVTAILDSIGYPKRSEFGDSTALGTFSVIQHASLH